MSSSTINWNKRRWVVLVAGLIICFLHGTNSCWSIYVGGMQANDFAYFSGQTGDISLTSIQLGFTIAGLAFVIWAFIAGVLKNRVGVKPLMVGASIIAACAMFLASFWVTTTWQLTITWGIVMACGLTTLYSLVQTVPIAFFPERRGLIAGLMMAVNPLGVIVFSPIDQWIIGTWGIRTLFAIMGVLFLLCFGLASLFMAEPPEGWVPDGYVAPQGVATTNEGIVSKTTSETVRDVRFWLMVFTLLAFILANLMFTAQGRAMALEFGGLDPVEGAGAAALAVSAINVIGLIGRFLCGALSDKLGRERTAMILAIVAAVMALLIGFVVRNSLIGFIVVAGLLVLCAGAAGGLFNAMNLDYFGPKYATKNYSLLNIAMSVGAFAGPMLSSMIYDATGSFTTALVVVAVLLAVAAVSSFILLSMKKARQKAASAEAASAVAAA